MGVMVYEYGLLGVGLVVGITHGVRRGGYIHKT